MASDEIDSLKEQLHIQNVEIDRLRKLLESSQRPSADVFSAHDESVPSIQPTDQLSNSSIKRYSRQLILPELGVQGQLLLGKTSVLVVGCGGLGCPAAIYLAAAGIGCLGLVDHDEVEISNLHRQILHTESRVDVCKASSAAVACNQLNSSVVCVPYHLALDSTNALDIINNYDIVLDATDNVATRYLLNDACVLAGKPLVSGSALRFEGQLTVYNHEGSPCYRCLFPTPPPAETVTNCSDGGVLGVVPGIIGSLQALEAIKLAAKMGTTYAQRLLMFDGLDGSFKTIKLRPKQDKCVVCGSNPSITQLIDYEQFCGTRATDKDKSLSVLTSEHRISVQEYKSVIDTRARHVLVDVRQPVEMEVCALPNTINIPLNSLHKPQSIQELKNLCQPEAEKQQLPVYVICRRGNDSQLAVNILRDKLKDSDICLKDIKGGLTAWAAHVDHNFPTY